MKHLPAFAVMILLFSAMVLLNSCTAIAGIFKAGMWTGIIIILVVVGLIIFIISRARK